MLLYFIFEFSGRREKNKKMFSLIRMLNGLSNSFL